MWAHVLQVMFHRIDRSSNEELSHLPNGDDGISRMLPFRRIKHVYLVAGLASGLEFKPG
jgi:hypothetical protein